MLFPLRILPLGCLNGKPKSMKQVASGTLMAFLCVCVYSPSRPTEGRDQTTSWLAGISPKASFHLLRLILTLSGVAELFLLVQIGHGLFFHWHLKQTEWYHEKIMFCWSRTLNLSRHDSFEALGRINLTIPLPHPMHRA